MTSAAFLLTSALAYDVADLSRLALTISGPSGSMNFDLTLNSENRFSAEIQNLDAGMTEITLDGYDASGTKMYDGDWEGTVRSDGKPTQVALYMVDLSPDIDYAQVSNVAPFFTSIEVEPSNIAHNETTYIRTRARDLDGTDLNYTFTPLDTLYGDTVECGNGEPYCVTEYTSSEDDPNGVKNFEMEVTDGEDTDSVQGAFNVRAFGSVDIQVTFNSRPGASSVSVGPSSFLTSDRPTVTVNASLFDDQNATWSWSVRGNGTECDASGFSGDVSGDFSGTQDTSVDFTAYDFSSESSCVLELRVVDNVAPSLEYHLTVPVVAGTLQSNSAPHVLYAYSTSRHPSSGDAVTYVVRAMDTAGVLEATWDVSSPSVGTVTTTDSTDHSTGGDSVYEFEMTMTSGGGGGTVTCSVEDDGGLWHNTTFVVQASQVTYSQPASNGGSCPAGTEHVTDRDECMDAVSQLGHVWSEDPTVGYSPSPTGSGYCVQCDYCSNPVGYMYEDLATSGDYWLRYYCKETSGRRLAIDDRVSGAVSPYVFGLDMRIEDGTLFLQSNTVPVPAPAPVPVVHGARTEEPDSDSGTSAGAIAGIVCACVGVTAGVVALALRHKRASTPLPETV